MHYAAKRQNAYEAEKICSDIYIFALVQATKRHNLGTSITFDPNLRTEVCIFEHGSLKQHLKCLALIVVAINSFIALGYHVVVACGFTVIIRKSPVAIHSPLTKVFVLVTFASPPRTLNR